MTGHCVRSSVGPGFDSVESFFFVFFSFPSYSSTCISFFPLLFCPPLISSSPFPLPSFLFFLSTVLFPFVFFLFYFLFPPFCSFSFSLSSLYFPDFFLLFLSSLFLILFVFVFSFSPLNFFLVSPLYQGGCYEHKGSLTFLPPPCHNEKFWGEHYVHIVAPT